MNVRHAAAALQVVPDRCADGETTLARMIWARVERNPARTVMRHKRYGIWRTVSWGEFGGRIRDCANALLDIGFEAEQKACILAANRPEWAFADFAVMAVGGVSVGVYPTSSASQVEYHLADSGAVAVFVEDDRQLDKVLEVRDRLPALKKIVVFDMTGLHDYRDPMVTSFDDFLAAGEKLGAGRPAEFTARLDAGHADDVALIVYTSGTTGHPKGAQITHRNALAQARVGVALLGLCEQDELLSYLPLCHGAERVWNSLVGLSAGAVINYVESLDTLAENTGEVRPTVMLGVPRVWEKMYSFITLGVKDAAPLQRLLYRWAMHAARQGEARGAPSLALALLRPLVLDNIKEMLGLGRCRLAITGAAPISPDLIEWFRLLGLRMVEGYGQTEASGMIAIGLPEAAPRGAVGKPVPGLEVRLSEAGEILVRGESVFAGYLNKDAATAETVRDGWLHTGDIGAFDAAGNLSITDRLKDVIITAGGKNVTPSEIESQLKFSPYISDAIVIGDRRKFLAALVVIDHDNVDAHARDIGLAYRDFAELSRSDEVRELIWKEIEAVNAKVARVETIKRFRIIEYKLTAEDEEMTPTMKLKRRLVERMYSSMIDEMYAEKENA